MVEITINSLKSEGFVECPQCRHWHGVKMNPKAYLSKTRTNRKTGQKETSTSVSVLCDTCCTQLLEAFTSPDWKFFYPEFTEAEVEVIVSTIKANRQAQLERFRT